MIVKLRGGLCLLALVALFPSTIAAASPAYGNDEDELRIAGCIRQASGGHGWLQKTLWGFRDQEGGWIGAEIANVDGSFDLGPLQVNSRWVARIASVTKRDPDRVRWWLIHDPCFNVETARWIFLTGLGGAHGYWKAVGIYHSPTNWRQLRYAEGVAMHLRRRFGPAAFNLKPDDRAVP